MAETFGKTDKGASEYNFTDDNIWVCTYVSGSAGDLASMSVYIKEKNGGNIKLAIYNADLSLVTNGTTEEKAIPGAQDGWMHFNFSTPPTVLAATTYLLCFWMNKDNYGYYTGGGVDYIRYDSELYGVWPDPMSGLSNLLKAYVSIYATYVEPPSILNVIMIQCSPIAKENKIYRRLKNLWLPTPPVNVPKRIMV